LKLVAYPPAISNIFAPLPNHSYVIDFNLIAHKGAISWKVRLPLVMDRSDWPAA
jgi:hypothetical protein